jgi:hypothetical protein
MGHMNMCAVSIILLPENIMLILCAYLSDRTGARQLSVTDELVLVTAPLQLHLSTKRLRNLTNI